VEPLSLAAGIGVVAAAAGVGTGARLRRRLRRAEAAVAGLRRELQVEYRAAHHDPLTGLPNRRAFFRLGDGLVADPVRPAIACVVIDLNCFKPINDTLGHAAGDEVLVTVADRLATYAGDDLVARLGGDEFAGLFTDRGTGWQLLYPAGDELAELLAAPMRVGDRELRLTAAVGMTPVRRADGLATALHQADCAMYRAKVTGAGVACFTPALDDDTAAPAGGRTPPPGGRAPAPAAPDVDPAGVDRAGVAVARARVAAPRATVTASGPTLVATWPGRPTAPARQLVEAGHPGPVRS
jgi:diguanylate cyclase (GGDEF)-like protein